MNETIKRFKLLFILQTLFFLLILILGTTRINYSFRAPGYNDNVDQFLTIEDGYKEEGSFHTTSVIAFDRLTILQYMVGNIMPKVDIKEFPDFYEGTDISDLTVMGYLMKDDSLHTALIVAIEKAGLEITYDSYNTVYLTYSHLTSNTLEPGDKILHVNGDVDFRTALANTPCDQSANITVLRGDDTLTFTITKTNPNPQNPDSVCSFGIYVDILTEIIDSEVQYSITRSNTQGPSGGLLQTLYIYNELTPYDYTHGLKIGGTGTIHVDGSVGYVGSIRQKVITSIANGIDIFFVPYLGEEDYDNYIEALRVLDEFNTDMIVVGVSSFDEAIAYLEGLGENND